MMMCWNHQLKTEKKWRLPHSMKRSIWRIWVFSLYGVKKDIARMNEQVLDPHWNLMVSGAVFRVRVQKPFFLPKPLQKFPPGSFPIRLQEKSAGCFWNISGKLHLPV